MAEDVRRIVAEFTARNKAAGEIAAYNRQINKTRQTVMNLGRSMLNLAGVGGGMYAVKALMTSSVREFASYEKQLANVSTMLDDHTMRYMPRYNAQLRKMSTEFGEGTETLSKGLYDILSASIAPAKAMNVLTVSTKAAKAGLTDTGIAADAITTILNSYSWEAERAGDVSDKMFAIVKRGKTTFAELAPNIGKVSALAATAGVNFDDLGASLATMTRAGVQTEIAITSLRAIILSFLKPQNDSIEMARKYGVELNSQTLRTIGLTGVVQKLKKATAEELAVIVPTSRAITGFAAAIQKAESQASDYDFILNSLGKTEEAYQKIAGTTAFKLEQTSMYWKEFKRTIGGEVAPALNAVLPLLNDTISLLDKMSPALLVLTQVNTAMRELEKRKIDFKITDISPLLLTINQIKKAIDEINKSPGITPMNEAEKRILESVNYEQYRKPELPGTEGAAALTKEQMTKIVASTREAMESVRHQDYLTRMERIQSLRIYQSENSDTLSQVAEANKLLDEEIRSIERSRLNQMKVYNAELREDFQNLNLYMSEKYADTFRAMESEGSSFFFNTMKDADNWRDHLANTFTNIGDSFARMASDMIARWLMMKTIGMFLGSPGGFSSPSTGGGGYGGTGGGGPTGGGSRSMIGHGGGIVGEDYFPTRQVSPAVFANAPRLHEGLRSNEVPAILEKGETVLPKGAAAGGVTNITIQTLDTMTMSQWVWKNRKMFADANLSTLKSNHPARRYEG